MNAVATAEALSLAEERKLNDLEGIIERGLHTFVEVGAALGQIREQRLYRETHGTFEDYCQERWGWTSRRSEQLMAASAAVVSLDANNCSPPANEAQARELARAPKPQRAEVWETVVEETKGARITAKKVAEVRDRIITPAPDDGPKEDHPWGDEDKWCWKLKNLYMQAPKRSRAAFRKWVLEAE